MAKTSILCCPCSSGSRVLSMTASALNASHNIQCSTYIIVDCYSHQNSLIVCSSYVEHLWSWWQAGEHMLGAVWLMFLFLVIFVTIFSNSTSVRENFCCAIWKYVKYAFICKLKYINWISMHKVMYTWNFRGQNRSENVNPSLRKLLVAVPKWLALREAGTDARLMRGLL